MARSSVILETRDGKCETQVFRPDESGGPWPAVLVFMDGIGMRPALHAIAARIAAAGYFVLLPDLFYRAAPYEPADPQRLFSDPELRAQWSQRFIGALSHEKVRSDTETFLDFVARQPDVKQSAGVGTTGYCMGGGYALAAAGNFPDRVVAAASYHGGRLATDAPDSPHLLAPKTKARVYVAGAIEDASFPDDQKARLDAALTAAKVAHQIETYPAKHGWVPSDTPSHDPVCAERHFQSLFALLHAALRIG